MNRTQAIERVDQILGLLADMYVAGRCPRCEVLLYDPEDRQLPPGALPPDESSTRNHASSGARPRSLPG
jgi:hypothetical protein